jgi:hypothetical protein
MNIAHLSMTAAPKDIGSVDETEIRASDPDRRHSHGNSVLYIEQMGPKRRYVNEKGGVR